MLGRQGYAVVSCHVERPLDDRAWSRYVALLRRRPSGFEITSLVRPPAPGEDEAVWLDRAREAAALAAFGHHTHWTSAEHARPTTGGAGDRVLEEGIRLREAALDARFFCGGGWYFDVGVAAAAAELGYCDCTATPARPPYLAPGEPRLELAAPGRLRLGDGRILLELPSTHSIGAGLRALAGLPGIVHVYFHDYDLLDSRRRRGLLALLAALALVRRPSSLAELAAAVADDAPELPLADALA